MLLLHPHIDKHITQKLQKNPITYERDVSLFLHHVIITHGRPGFWAVDLGANIGFHTLYIASLGAKVIALEPAPDTAQLLRGSLALNPSMAEHVILVEAGAADVYSTGHLSRHVDSPGMTTLGATNDLPWSFKGVQGGGEQQQQQQNETITSTITLVPVEKILEEYGLPEMGDSSQEDLLLLKVDVEGYELHAFQGLNLDRYPFRYILFEFFPQLIHASGSDPIELLAFVTSRGYKCIEGWSTVNGFDKRLIGESRNELEEWTAKVKKSHTNVYCQR
jgi:FkbM family methyltransferase